MSARSVLSVWLNVLVRRFDYFIRKAEIGFQILTAVRAALAHHVDVHGLQLQFIGIPPEVEEVLLQTATTRLRIIQGRRYKAAMKVAFEALAMVARYNYTVKVNLAIGAARAVAQLALATATQTSQTVSAEMAAFANVSRGIPIEPVEVLQYSWFNQLLGARQVPMDRLFVGGALGRKRRGW